MSMTTIASKPVSTGLTQTPPIIDPTRLSSVAGGLTRAVRLSSSPSAFFGVL